MQRQISLLNAPSTNLLEHLAFEEETIGPTLLEWETMLQASPCAYSL